MRPATLAGSVLLAAVGCDPGQPGPQRSVEPPDNSVTGRGWDEVSVPTVGYKVRFPRSFAVQNRPFVEAAEPEGVTQIDVRSAERFDHDGLSHALMVVAGRLARGGFRTEERTRAALDRMVGQVRIPPEARRSEPRAVTWGGRPAAETVYQADGSGGGKKVRIVVRQMATESVAYVGIIRHPGDLTPAEEARFWDGFQVVPPGGGKGK